jgi:hypothetical protein
MKNTGWLVSAVVALLVLNGRTIAFAQSGGDAAGSAPSEGSEFADPAASNPGMVAPVEATDKWAAWPTRFIDRPRTLPKGMIEAGGYLDISRFNVTAGGMTSTSSSTALTAAGGYGVSDKLEVRASYGISLDPSSGKGPFAVEAGFGFAEGKLAIAGRGDFSYDLGSESGGVGLGASVRYLIKPDLGLYTSRQLVITLISNGAKPATLELPIGAGYQLNDHLYLFGETKIASINLQDSVSRGLFADFIPITVGGVFALSAKIEVGGTFSTDLKNDAFDALQLGGFGRFYF